MRAPPHPTASLLHHLAVAVAEAAVYFSRTVLWPPVCKHHLLSSAGHAGGFLPLLEGRQQDTLRPMPHLTLRLYSAPPSHVVSSLGTSSIKQPFQFILRLVDHKSTCTNTDATGTGHADRAGPHGSPAPWGSHSGGGGERRATLNTHKNILEKNLTGMSDIRFFFKKDNSLLLNMTVLL